jgi:peptide subunit release factor 1 (eRF1)
MPVVRAAADQLPYVLVEIDHLGAEVSVVGPEPNDEASLDIEGGHDVLHKFHGGGWSHRRFQMRVDDSWERNAETVAARLERLVEHFGPHTVLVTGDPHARGYLRRHAGARTEPLLRDIGGDARAAGASPEALAEHVDSALYEQRLIENGDLLAQFEQRRSKGLAANGLAEVVYALRQGAVETLLLQDDPRSTLRLWAGAEPTQIGMQQSDVTELGSQIAVEDRADDVLVRALIAQAGDVELVNAAEVLTDGIGAMLRFEVHA